MSDSQPGFTTAEQQAIMRAMRDWSSRAACIGNEWFIQPLDELTQDVMSEMKAICKGCPVTMECLAHALNFPERGGVWGGMGPKERTQYRLKQARENTRKKIEERFRSRR